MNKYIHTYIWQIVFFFLGNIAYGQQNAHLEIHFKDAKMHHVQLRKVLNDSFYSESLPILKSSKAGQVRFEGAISYPYYVELIVDSMFFSDPFVLYPDSNVVNLSWQKDNLFLLRDDNYIRDDTYAKYKELVTPYYDILRYLQDHKLGTEMELDALLQSGYNNSDTILYQYAQANPSSYLGLYKLATTIQFGYKDLFKPTYNAFDVAIRNSKPGKRIGEVLMQMEKYAIGRQFPDLYLPDEQQNRIDLGREIKKSTYVLVNFWYSNCGPCIAKFPKLTELYNAFKDQGFSIVGISTDTEEEKWTHAIQKYNIPWLNLLDRDHSSADQLNIVAYPSSFLVDSSGEIIAINVSPMSLERFLKKTLVLKN